MQDAATDQRPKLHVSRQGPTAWVKGAGRRECQIYRDMGMRDATHGRVKLAGNRIVKATDHKETGWHYHTCEFQIRYILNGWVEIQFEELGTIKLHAGDAICIPPFMPHNETRVSDDC